MSALDSFVNPKNVDTSGRLITFAPQPLHKHYKPDFSGLTLV